MDLRGIVIHTASFDESSRVIEALTADEGKLACVARGARASKKRFAGGLDVFSTLELSVTPTANLWRLESTTLVTPRLGIRRSLESFERAGRLTECARALSNPHQQSREQLLALEAGLDACDRLDLISAAAAYLRLLAAAGILPEELPTDVRTTAEADALEHQAMRWIELHLGHTLKTRVTPVTDDGKRTLR